MNKKDLNLLLPASALIVAIAGFLISYKLLMPPVADNLAKISAHKSDIGRAEEKLSSISTTEKSLAELSDLVNNLLIAVPDSVNAPDLITEIETIAAQSQVALPSITPPEDIDSGAGASAGGVIGTTSNGSSGLTVNISIAGPFQNIYNFISALETSIRFSKITTLTITSSQEGNLGASIAFEVYKRPSKAASSDKEANNESE